MNDTLTTAPATGTDALSLLASDHREVERLFAEYEAASGDATERKREIALEVCRELTLHAAAEEQLFYPALRQAGAHHTLLERAHEEHVEAKAVIGDIQTALAEGRDPDWKVGQLIRAVRMHVQEEESELFAAARQCGIDLTALGEQLQQRKQDMVEERIGHPPIIENAADNVSRAAASL
jgi:hemerythrin superfamily protein